MKKGLMFFSIGILMLLGVVSAANATLVSTTYNYPLNDIAPTWSGNFAVDRFDTGLGILNSVTLTFSGDIAGTTSTKTGNNDVEHTWTVYP